MMSVTQAVFVTLILAVIIFAERLFPFVVFSKKQPGPLIHFFERYVPPAVMLGLLIYSLRGIRFSSLELWLPHITAIVFSIITYVWKKNSLISIFGATIIYMVMIRIL